jgi:ribosomal protein S18 acetylase RimI-like enzyme
MIDVERLEQPGELAALAEILQACVQDGASVGFVLPFTMAEARTFWVDRVFPGVQAGASDLFVARLGDVVIGTVQLVKAAMPNQPHRADVAKLLVHPDHRRHGAGRLLMAALEERARALDLGLLVLDTRSGDPSQSLYETLGYQVAGEIPGYCLNPYDQRPEPTSYLYKALTP